jgi:hypothetical protein
MYTSMEGGKLNSPGVVNEANVTELGPIWDLRRLLMPSRILLDCFVICITVLYYNIDIQLTTSAQVFFVLTIIHW